MLEQNQLCFPALSAAEGSTFFLDSTLLRVFPVWRNAIILMTVIKNRFRSIVRAYSISHHHNELFNLHLSIKYFEILRLDIPSRAYTAVLLSVIYQYS